MAESQLAQLQNMRVLIEETKELGRSLAYHRRAKIEVKLDQTFAEIERQIEELRVDRS